MQFAVHDRLTADGKDAMAGWKVALTLPSQYEPMKLSGPVFAGIYQSGVRQSGAVFEKGWPIKAGIECEMVARMAKDVTAAGTPYTAETIKPFVANFYCGAEVVENRYADVTKVSGPGRIADDVLQAACIVGTEIKDWQTLDFAGVKGRSLFDGQGNRRRPRHQRHGRRADLARLARQQAHQAWQVPQAGDVILTGSVHPPVFLPGPGIAKTEFVGLGGIGDHDQLAERGLQARKLRKGREPIWRPLSQAVQGGTASIPMPVAWALDSGRPTRGDVEDRLEERERGPSTCASKAEASRASILLIAPADRASSSQRRSCHRRGGGPAGCIRVPPGRKLRNDPRSFSRPLSFARPLAAGGVASRRAAHGQRVPRRGEHALGSRNAASC